MSEINEGLAGKFSEILHPRKRSGEFTYKPGDVVQIGDSRVHGRIDRIEGKNAFLTVHDSHGSTAAPVPLANLRPPMQANVPDPMDDPIRKQYGGTGHESFLRNYTSDGSRVVTPNEVRTVQSSLEAVGRKDLSKKLGQEAKAAKGASNFQASRETWDAIRRHVAVKPKSSDPQDWDAQAALGKK